jgi:hypothetical protein
VRSAKSVGRIIGLMFLVQMLLAPLVYLRLMRPVTAPGFLTSAAGSALQIRVAVLLTFGLGALTLAIAITATPVFRRYSERVALAFLALSIVGLATLAMEMAATLLSITVVTMPLLGYRFVFLMLIPVALSQLGLMPWLIVRGLQERRHLLRGDAERFELARA